VKGADRIESFTDVCEYAFFPYEKTLLLQALFKSRFLEALLRLFETRERREPFIERLHLAANINYSTARAFKF